MQKFKYVKYLVGMFLIFPIYCIHKVPIVEEPSSKKKNNNFPSKEQSPQKGKSDNTQASHKRTCGQANKSVRMNHKK